MDPIPPVPGLLTSKCGIAVNYDEAAAGGEPLPPLVGAGERGAVLDFFARRVYGPLPPAPDRLDVAVTPLASDLPNARVDLLTLTLEVAGRRLERQTMLWRPAAVPGPLPLIVGLAFLGPAGSSLDPAIPLDPDGHADVDLRQGVVDGRITEASRFQHAHQWPLPLILASGHALALSGYGAWVPDHPERWQASGLWPLLRPAPGPEAPGAIALWAWALARMVDAVLTLPGIDPARIALAGHSRLGKAALWAAANDPRVGAVILNNAGCMGPAPSRRRFGETPLHMVRGFPHWLAPGFADLAADPDALPFDQHHLLATLAPRRLHVASGALDLWADPKGEYLGLRAAAPAWGLALPAAEQVMATGASLHQGALGWHLRPGGHAMTPYDWRHYLAFLDGATLAPA